LWHEVGFSQNKKDNLSINPRVCRGVTSSGAGTLEYVAQGLLKAINYAVFWPQMFPNLGNAPCAIWRNLRKERLIGAFIEMFI